MESTSAPNTEGNTRERKQMGAPTKVAEITNDNNMEDTVKDLQKFVGSAEEKRLLRGISYEFERQPDFFNVVLESCNASKGVSFTQADVTLQYLTQYKLYSKLDLVVSPEDYRMMVSSNDVFNMNPLTEVAERGLTSFCRPEYKDYAPAFLALLRFFKNIDEHQSALHSVMQNYEHDSQLTAALAYHLFSQLTPGQEYIVDKYSSHLPTVCPCGCKGTIKTGITSLGSDDTWHGFVDLMLNQNVPVAVLKKEEETKTDSEVNNLSTVSENRHEERETEDNDNNEVGSTTSEGTAMSASTPLNEPPFKRSRQDVSENKDVSGDVLLSLHAFDQIVAVTITNAFSQVRNDADLHKWLIPTIGCSSDNVLVFMYNSQYDILLQSSRLMSLWCGPDSKKLNLGTVLCIWMLINFKLFTKPSLNEKLDFKKSRFCDLAGNSLVFYQNIETPDSYQNVDLCSYAAQHYGLVYRYLRSTENEAATKTETLTSQSTEI